MEQSNKFFQEFNRIQNSFYTSKEDFENYTQYELKKHGYVLISNLAKGFPHLAEMIGNLSGINWSGCDSPAILLAVQHKLINQYAGQNRKIVPNFVYFKNLKPVEDKEKKTRKSKNTEKGLEFDNQTKNDIMSILMIDSKTYEYLKFSNKIQTIGKQILVSYTQLKDKKNANNN